MFNKIYYLGNTDIEDPKDEKAIHKLMANMSAVSYFLAIIELPIRFGMAFSGNMML